MVRGAASRAAPGSRKPEAGSPAARYRGADHREQVHLGELLFREHCSQTQVQVALGQVLVHHGEEVAVLVRRPSRWHQQRDRGLLHARVELPELVDRVFEQLAGRLAGDLDVELLDLFRKHRRHPVQSVP